MTLWVVAVAALALGLAAGRWLVAGRTRRDLENARRELARRLAELFSLQELAYLLSESLQVEHIVMQVARYVTKFLNVRGSAIALTSAPGDPVRIAAAEGTLASLLGNILSADDAAKIGAATGQERLQLTDAAKGHPHPWTATVEFQRSAAAPLRAHGVTLGALVVVDRVDGEFTDEDLRFLSTVATHAAIVLANARFFDQIRSGKEQWETTFDALAEGIAVLDGTGRVQRANRALATLLGRPLPAVIGVDLVAALGGSPEMASLLASTRKGLSHPGVTLESRALERILRITAAPMSGDENGQIVAMVDDVTDEKAMETQLIQNEKMVAVGQLVSGVAHELNNPLTSIAGLSEFLLEQTSGGEKEREHLRVIQEQADRAGRIVRNLLTFARKGPSDLADLDLNDVIQRTVMLIGYELKLREVQLQANLLPSLPAVRGDRYEIQQVVLNLLNNAVQAVSGNPPDRPRQLQVETLQEGSEVVMRVSDSGPGIAPEHLSQIFTPFFTTKQAGQGTGLGLSISFGIVERHGGRLSVERSKGGAVFTMTLPVPRAVAGEVRGPEQLALPMPDPTPPSAPEKEPASAYPRRVLLVDDDPAVQRTIRALFSRDGQTVETPPNAEDAMRRIGKDGFDLIIADARAAVSAGETFATVLLNRWPKLKSKTILITGDVRPETHDWLRSLGCSYFQKPFKVSDLKEAAARIAASPSA
jgi:two-component system NtrC family sensor kinase